MMEHEETDETEGETPAEADADGRQIRVVSSLNDISSDVFDACANPSGQPFNPFVSYAFLCALEETRCVGAHAGWHPQHLVLEDGQGEILGIMPTYLKSHSRGEFVFDYAWADAYARAGGRYYPKLLAAVPFTPVPGPRLLVRPDPAEEENEKILAAASLEIARRMELSSVHITFLKEDAWQRLGALGFLQRTDQQFHFANPGYGSFDDFLETLASRKRKSLRKERAQAICEGLVIEHVRGAEITEAHWDAFYEFYIDTSDRKWGDPYLNRKFFSVLGERLPDSCLLIMAKRDGRYIAGALNLIGGDCLYGRYWGAIEHHPFLHFEVCYYQAIDFAIANGLARVEAGAQGQHKLARGYVPETTYSAHWFADPGLSAAVARYLRSERREVELTSEILSEHTPYKKS
ncbi:MAG: GNAT family N-acetyltransferase [Filomicrobium sp.]